MFLVQEGKENHFFDLFHANIKTYLYSWPLYLKYFLFIFTCKLKKKIFCSSCLSWKKVLKVLSSEMDPAEIRLIRKVVIKERGAAVFLEKSARPPSSESSLKY